MARAVRRRHLLALLAIAALASLPVLTHRSTCRGDATPASCVENYPREIQTVLLALAAAATLASVGLWSHAVLTDPDAKRRRRDLRVCLALLAAALLVPSSASALAWTRIPDGASWTLEDRTACARAHDYALGGTTWCTSVSTLVATPLLALAGLLATGPALQPRWTRAGWAGVAVGTLAVLAILALNHGAAGKTSWAGSAAVLAGIAGALWMLGHSPAARRAPDGPA